MKKKYFVNIIVVLVLFFQVGFSQTNSTVGQANGAWTALMKGDRFDPNDDQQSVADTDFVGNTAYAMVETQKEIINFNDGITDETYFFRVRMGQSIPKTSFYIGVDITGDNIADLFIEANTKAQTPYVSYHKRDYTKSGISPSQTAWTNGVQNGEQMLTVRNANIMSYSAGTNIDGGNSGVDYWIEFGFTEESLKSWIFTNLGLNFTGDSLIALYAFTSTSQTSNGDVAGVNDTIPGILDKTWNELGVIINGSLNNVASGEILRPTVVSQTTTNASPTITGTWGGAMLGDDTLTVTVNGITYSEEIYINNGNWSLTILYPELAAGTYEVVVTTTRTSTNQTSTDNTTAELVILPGTITTVSSGNDGGLESNGDLATLIAKRNFNRIKTNSYKDKKALQNPYYARSGLSSTTFSQYDFSNLIPSIGLTGTETTYISSPTDLIGITNAEEVYSVDYYQGENRVAAVLATKTSGSIYGHSKAICDRLNDSSLEDIQVINLNGHQIILAKIKRANGFVEFALNFSVQRLGNENTLHSYWNIDQYPTGNYLNFQVWGSSTGQVCNIANAIIANFIELGTLNTTIVQNRIPTVFVKKGSYKNGQLHLSLINKSNAFNLSFQGNKKVTELALSEYVSQNISLTGSYEQDIELNLGGLFDIGLSIIGDTSNQQDALYMADGPWGLDYIASENNITGFDISNDDTQVASEEYKIERNINIAGEIYGTVNVFRNIRPGELTFNADAYSSVSFSLQNALPVEIVLVTEGLSDWNNRLRIVLPAHTSNTEITIPLIDFVNTLGVSFNQENIKGFVFSTSGNYTTTQPFAISISNLKLGNTAALGIATNEPLSFKPLYNYPNPCHASTTVVLPKPSASVIIKIIDETGRVVVSEKKAVTSFNNEILISTESLNLGIYILEVTTDENKTLYTKFLKN